MLVSIEWLADYVDLPQDLEELADRFSLTGLNHESTTQVDGHTVFDLEVTSNRGDCLCHLGVAREVAAIYGHAWKQPLVDLPTGKQAIGEWLTVENEFHEGCPVYTARVLTGVRVGPSPDWLKSRLVACGINSVNNVVDITNLVMLECGQPLHAFDYQQIRGKKICVRRSRANESFEAIDHKTYQLQSECVVIADSERGIALGGVMGGVDSEVTDSTTDLVIESADFAPQLIRQAARGLRLHSPASYRFERRINRQGIDWASQRCCELILEHCGGQLVDGVAVAGDLQHSSSKIVLRMHQIERILGIAIDPAICERILTALGCQTVTQSPSEMTVCPPAWRHDLTREADLIEEVARIHGYDQIPENVNVPSIVSSKRAKDHMLDRVRQLCNAAGFDEAMTPSIVADNLDDLGSFWTAEPPLQTSVALLEGATRLRRSIATSLLQPYRWNISQTGAIPSLFETAVVYLPQPNSVLPRERFLLGMVSNDEFRSVKGLVTEIIRRSTGTQPIQEVLAVENALLDCDAAIGFRNGDGVMIGMLGRIHPATAKKLKLPESTLLGELDLDTLLANFQDTPQLVPHSLFPAVERDLNFIVDESVTWQRLEEAITNAAGPLLKRVDYHETYRDLKKDGPDKKRVLVSLLLQSEIATLEAEQANQVIEAVVSACGSQLNATLVA